MTTFSPKRPYFLRAMHEWLSDNDLTPYLIVDCSCPDVVAPTEYAQGGILVLNIGYSATHNLRIDDDAISFAARFGGVSQDLWIPMAAALAIRAKEDDAEIFAFDPSEYQDQKTQTPKKPESAPAAEKSQKPTNPLKILK